MIIVFLNGELYFKGKLKDENEKLQEKKPIHLMGIDKYIIEYSVSEIGSDINIETNEINDDLIKTTETIKITACKN